MENNKVLNLYPIDYPFETLIERVKTSKLRLNPEFQRKYKWDKDGNERASKFIESCLMRIPLPACYFAENEDNSQDVIDGVQRITTIVNFFNDGFALEGMSVYEELNNKKFSEIGSFQSELETTTIRCIILRKDNSRDLIKEIFARLNQGAVELTAQEIRHAIYPGNLDELLTELSKIQLVETFGLGLKGKSIKDGREAEEMVLRFFAMNGDLRDYEDKLSKYLDKFMFNNKVLSEENFAAFKNYYIETLNKCINVFGDKVFMDTNMSRHKQSLVYYDLLMWSFSQEESDFLNNNKDEIKDSFKSMCASPEFRKSLSGGLQMKPTIVTRRNLWTEKLNDIKNAN